jgi:hypothetical protein
VFKITTDTAVVLGGEQRQIIEPYKGRYGGEYKLL